MHRRFLTLVAGVVMIAATLSGAPTAQEAPEQAPPPSEPCNEATMVSVAGCAEPKESGDNTVSIISTPARMAIKWHMLEVPPMSWQWSRTGSLSLARSLMPLIIL